VYRALLPHGLVDGKKRKRRREDYRRWECGRARPPSCEPVPLWSRRTVVGPRHTCRAVRRGRGL